jgi:hypothetical protein
LNDWSEQVYKYEEGMRNGGVKDKVVVMDMSGQSAGVWGSMNGIAWTHNEGMAGIVIDGSIRDTYEANLEGIILDRDQKARAGARYTTLPRPCWSRLHFPAVTYPTDNKVWDILSSRSGSLGGFSSCHFRNALKESPSTIPRTMVPNFIPVGLYIIEQHVYDFTTLSK